MAIKIKADKTDVHYKVMSCFACGGGSSMGYKMAGFDVVAANEIDTKLAKMYQRNLEPKQLFNCDVRDLLKDDVELPEVDVLDGSPPCSTFTINGDRERSLQKKKTFREGQSEQVLSDLFYQFIKLADKVKPKVVIAENVKGIIMGAMRDKYHRRIMQEFEKIGYQPRCFLVNGAAIGIPQRRERVFYVAVRGTKNDFELDKTRGKLMRFKDIRDDSGVQYKKSKDSGYGVRRISLFDVPPTITSGNDVYIKELKRNINLNELLSISTWPKDYDFMGNDPHWTCGMSVPPGMMHFVAGQVRDKILNNPEYDYGG